MSACPCVCVCVFSVRVESRCSVKRIQAGEQKRQQDPPAPPAKKRRRKKERRTLSLCHCLCWSFPGLPVCPSSSCLPPSYLFLCLCVSILLFLPATNGHSSSLPSLCSGDIECHSEGGREREGESEGHGHDRTLTWRHIVSQSLGRSPSMDMQQQQQPEQPVLSNHSSSCCTPSLSFDCE